VDATNFERAWINLVSNAIDAAKSEVRLELKIVDASLFVRVIDDGLGVPQAFLPKLFQRGATHGKPEGTGLGLAYVRQIIRGHGGDVTYRREEKVTVFECYLPNVIVDSESEDRKSSQDCPETAIVPERQQLLVKQVSICFDSAELNQRVYERLSKIPQSTHSFVIGFDKKSSIVLTDSEETADLASEANLRPILISSLIDDEIVRRVPIRLGIKG
jgi:hypothetical protein